MAGTGTRIEQGWVGTGITAAQLAANTGVTWDNAGLLKNCGAGDKGIGSVQEAFPISVEAGYVRKIGGCWLQYSGTVVAGDLVKFTTGGILIADTVSGSTAQSVDTVGVVREVNGGASMCFMEWL
jgi:hypothetical protein